MRFFLILLLFNIHLNHALDFYCFLGEMNIDDDLSRFIQNTNCTHIVVRNFANLSADGISIKYPPPIMKMSRLTQKVNLLAGINLVDPVPMNVEDNNKYIRNITSGMNKLGFLNPFTGKHFIKGVFIQEKNFSKHVDFFGLFSLLSKLRKVSAPFKFIVMEIYWNFSPYKIGFPTNARLGDIIDVFYLQTALDTYAARLHKNTLPHPATIQSVHMNPLFVSPNAFPEFALCFQYDKISKYVLNEKTVIGLSAGGRMFFHNNGTLLSLSPKKLDISETCTTSDNFGHVWYDRNSPSTSLYNSTHYIIFNMPGHTSFLNKLKWIDAQNFKGIGLESIENDLDLHVKCHRSSALPLHNDVAVYLRSKIIVKPQNNYAPMFRVSNIQTTTHNAHEHSNHQFIPLPNGNMIEVEHYYNNSYFDQFRQILHKLNPTMAPPATSATTQIGAGHKEETPKTQKIANPQITPDSQTNNGQDDDSMIGKRELFNQEEDLKCEELCGIADDTFLPKENDNMHRTIGGSQLYTYQYPWIVFVRIFINCANGESLFVHCTGVLISYQDVLTDAHCLYANYDLYHRCRFSDWQPPFLRPKYIKLNNDRIRIHYGSHDLSDADSVRVKSVYIHENFNIDDNDKPRKYDLALLKLQVELSKENVRPICLFRHEAGSELMGELAISAGYGSHRMSYSDYALNKLSDVVVPIRSAEYCHTIFHSRLPFDYDEHLFICAGSKHKGLFPGDCGGPLMLERNGVHYLYGLATFGFHSSYKELMPDVYTRIGREYCDHISAKTDGRAKCHHQIFTNQQLRKCKDKWNEIMNSKYKKTCLIFVEDGGEVDNCAKQIFPFPQHEHALKNRLPYNDPES